MTKKLWQASLNQKKNSNLYAFENYVSKNLVKILIMIIKEY